MRVLVCPTAFKGTLAASDVTGALTAGVRDAIPDARVRQMPVSDGGPGLLEALAAVGGPGTVRRHAVRGPLGGPATARSLWLSGTEAVVESADACGLHLVPEWDRDPMRTDTRGVGELVAACLAAGARHVVIGLGGSATVDGGTGLGRVFGYRFTAADGSELPPGGGSLSTLARIHASVPSAASAPADHALDARGPARFTAVADVDAALCGPDGAARRFAAQKGADPSDVERLEEGLARLGDRLRIDLGADVSESPGAGAAGGLGAGCAAFLGAELTPGSSWVLDRVAFDDALRDTDLVLTGEGRWDATSALGKITWEVARRGAAAGVPVLLCCGSAAGPAPPGTTLVPGNGSALGPGDLRRLVAEALG